jgi:hypothetical protein
MPFSVVVQDNSLYSISKQPEPLYSVSRQHIALRTTGQVDYLLAIHTWNNWQWPSGARVLWPSGTHMGLNNV